ncbi:MAG: phage antirepressor KilAC domain-containing protein [Veillonella sp.]|jgi:toxin-antitoxin system, toxin component, bro family|uniref:phage antirepressor n=1 Tax=Veillonella sp. TaxID=1926307 RepID=UPI00204EF21A|nr:phage antirepressor KilAC domain-containing protein [Veillonella sp.]MDU6767733.1 phage antirepressor KilAC domain-containing protein [Veillonella sp.]MDU6769568.1 phage antirepressor KilAC domain-containing protein [Veillonella sp.]DAS52410.1 MAG TPA: repressor domain protein [Caudoviricetes sp.]
MTDLQIFNNDRFGQVRIIPVDGELMFVAKDVCDCLEITKHRDAISRLDSDERGSVKLDTPGGKQDIAAINEYGLYSLVLSSRKPEAKEFKRWITHDVIPAIRKTGSYSMVIPQTLPEALRAYADEVESHNATKAIVAQQEQQIAEFKPVKDYVDKILSSKSCLAITQIAADYGLSAQELNKILHEAGLQRKVGDQWILYKQHMAKGFTKSETFTFCRSDGRLDSKITTKWTQKGRLEIHSILTKLNIHAVCEDVA